MPRVSAAHEHAIRQRIVDSAIRVFGELGYGRATIQDVVRDSGLSVGAVYTYFRSKDDLFLVACACEAEQQVGDLRFRLAEMGSLPTRLRAAIDWAIEKTVGAPSGGLLLHAWSTAEHTPELHQLLRDRRTQMTAFSRLILEEARASGELPAWIDAEGLASAFVTLVDGLALRAMEGGIDRDAARRDAYSLLELLLAASPAEPPGVAEFRAGRAPSPNR